MNIKYLITPNPQGEQYIQIYQQYDILNKDSPSGVRGLFESAKVQKLALLSNPADKQILHWAK
jgi:hypothetical protein